MTPEQRVYYTKKNIAEFMAMDEGSRIKRLYDLFDLITSRTWDGDWHIRNKKASMEEAWGFARTGADLAWEWKQEMEKRKARR